MEPTSQNSSPRAHSGLDLPPGLLLEQDGKPLTSEECEAAALTQLQQKIERTTAKYNASFDLVALSSRVQKLIRLYTPFIENFHSPNGFKSHIQWSLETHIKAKQFVTDLEKFFIDRVNETEKSATLALGEKRFSDAERQFSSLEKALLHEQGSPRYFFLRCYMLTTHIQQEKILEAIHLLIELENGFLGDTTLRVWLNTQRTSLTAYVIQQVRLNEEQFAKYEALILSHVNVINTAFSLYNPDISAYIRVLEPAHQRLQEIKAGLQTRQERGRTLATYCKLLRSPYKSFSQKVFEKQREAEQFVNAALELLTEIARSPDEETTNSILCKWVKTHIAAFKEKQISSLHAWALLFLGKLFSTGTLSQKALDKSIELVRTHASAMVCHFYRFPQDIGFSYGLKCTDSSLLVLGIISDAIKTSCCTAPMIRQIRPTWDFSDLRRSLPGFIPGSLPTPRSLPKISFTDDITQGIEESAETQKEILFTNLTTVLEHLLLAFQHSKFEILRELTSEQKVTLFEVARDFLLMPDVLVDLSITEVNTTEFQKSLSALQWLRFVQATRTSFQYVYLEEIFPKVSRNEFFRWISLYNPKKVKIDPKNHHRLFFSLIDRAGVLCGDRSNFTEEQIVKIFTFFTHRYSELIQLDLNAKIKSKLAAKLIQFGARCVARASDSTPFEHQPTLQSISHLDTALLEEIGEIMKLASVQSWIETCILPTISSLTLHKPLTEEALTHFCHCKALKSLSMPGRADLEEGQWDMLHTHFRKLKSLTIDGGKAALDELEQFELRSLTLTNISDEIDFARCVKLQKSLRELSLSKVKIAPHSLSWVVASSSLTTLAIANPLSPIGRLAQNELPHATRALRSLALTNVFINKHQNFITSLEELSDEMLSDTLGKIANLDLLEFLQKLPERDFLRFITYLTGKDLTEQNISLNQEFVDEMRMKILDNEVLIAFRKLTAQKLIDYKLPSQELAAFIEILTSNPPSDQSLFDLLQEYSTAEIVAALDKLADEELLLSLPKLIATQQSTIDSITIQSSSDSSILELIQNASSIRELQIEWNEGEDLTWLSKFAHLERISFFSDVETISERIKVALDRLKLQELKECWVIRSTGYKVLISLDQY